MMRAYFSALVLAVCSGFFGVCYAADTTALGAPAISVGGPAQGDNPIAFYKTQLYQNLDAGSIELGNFEKQTEITIAQTQLELSKAYMDQGDRKLAIILGILARKTMQRAIGNPNDPAMIPIYSVLVQLYTSKIDTDNPDTDQSDAEKAKEYRELIDHIHAQ